MNRYLPFSSKKAESQEIAVIFSEIQFGPEYLSLFEIRIELLMLPAQMQ
jgi:hypothetical protein